MSNNLDIGWNCEEVVIQILGCTPALLALSPTHADSDKDTENVHLVVKAERVAPEAPNPRNPALNVRRVSMRVHLRASVGQITASALYRDYGTMCQVLENMDGVTYATVPALAAFTYLVPTLDLENEREKDENRRKMVKAFSFLAILANEPSLP